MKVTEKLARYILGLQSVYDLEVGLGEDDFEIRNQLEAEFPVLKREREHSEFNQWLWGTRVEREPDVIEARALLGHDIPFDDIYWADSKANPETLVDPNDPEGTYALYREHTEVAGELFHEVKQAAEERLLRLGEDDLRSEWELHRRIMESKR